MNLLWLFALVAVSIICNAAGSSILLESEIPHQKKCRYLTSYDLFQAVCKDVRMDTIPPNLQSGIEVLDARENRIRELKKDTLSPYKKLRYLYLQDNFIQEISKNAFDPVYYLEVIDISKNGLLELPRSLFQLRYLRNIYLNDNNLMDKNFYIQDVQSQLRWLHLSNNKLTKIPHLYPLPTLTVLNVSYNSITWLSPEDLAPFCSLQVLDLRGNRLKFSQSSCDCYELFRWQEDRNVKILPPLDCPIALRERCNGIKFSNRTQSLYNECQNIQKEKAAAIQARSLWIWIALSIGTFVSAVFVVLCCVHNKNKSQRQRLKEQEILEVNKANTEKLLDQAAQVEQA